MELLQQFKGIGLGFRNFAIAGMIVLNSSVPGGHDVEKDLDAGG
jgi:hypothetical protein